MHFGLKLNSGHRYEERLGIIAAQKLIKENAYWVSVSASPRALQLLAGQEMVFSLDNAYWNLETLPHQCRPEVSTNIISVSAPSSSVICTYPNPISFINAITSVDSHFEMDVIHNIDESIKITVESFLKDATGLETQSHLFAISDSQVHQQRSQPQITNNVDATEERIVVAELNELFAIASGTFLSHLDEFQIPVVTNSDTTEEIQNCNISGTTASVAQRKSDIISRWIHTYENCKEGESAHQGSISVTTSDHFTRATYSDVSVFDESGNQTLYVEQSVAFTDRLSVDGAMDAVTADSVGFVQSVDESGLSVEVSNFQGRCDLTGGESDSYLFGHLGKDGKHYVPEHADIRFTFNGSVLGGIAREHLVKMAIEDSSIVRMDAIEFNSDANDSSYEYTTVLSASVHLIDEPTLSVTFGPETGQPAWTIPMPPNLKFGCGFRRFESELVQ